MKFKSRLFLLLGLLPCALSAQWLNVGNADYNWGPFHVYTISLYSETGEYHAGQRPLMLSITFAKPVEGKDFAITLMKEMDSLNIEGLHRETIVTTLQKILPDFQPGDTLSYIALEGNGYFVINDTILNHDFDRQFTDAFVAIWLAENTNFTRLRSRLIGQQKNEVAQPEHPIAPESTPPSEENADPELLPKPDQAS
ncbi:hypothetical protein [Conservatibacter flavescens]|uniref:Chalcone isomerase domain-containing protein n=1 Tax=Conservatibacter flavescens TaxID=28161 RepID=A0A2M8S0S3_9PAST|nr:hypothetical protein [Conservatibacter flavescens]PJG84752.1 hypothetical protein CVP05_09425 [Conservatibacter flavescens]